MFEQIDLRGFLSFKETTLNLRPLNVVIGPNGSGKSNLIEALSILRATPSHLWGAITSAGGFQHLAWKGRDTPSQSKPIEMYATLQTSRETYRYSLSFEFRQGIPLIDEKIEKRIPEGIWQTFALRNDGAATIKLRIDGLDGFREINRESLVDPRSILEQIREPTQYPYLTDLGRYLEDVRIYRSFTSGPAAPPRLPQPADMANDCLREDEKNLGLVLNRFERDGTSVKVEAYLSRFLRSYRRISTQVEGGTVQIFLAERNRGALIPATRISDGTIRFLSLMAILCHPNPGSLICIEEPELGLHPDAVLLVAEAIKEASQRTQLIVTTHSEALVDALSDEPESVVVCERGADGSTQFSRLSSTDLDTWLEEYSLGRLWRKGEIGANP